MKENWEGLSVLAQISLQMQIILFFLQTGATFSQLKQNKKALDYFNQALNKCLVLLQQIEKKVGSNVYIQTLIQEIF